MTTLPRWTAADLAAVRADYPLAGAGPLAARLGRSPKAVRLKARELGVRPPPAWTPDMDAALAAEYGRTPTRELAARFGKTANATKQRALKLGLDAGRAYTAAEADAVRRLYPAATARQVAAAVYGDPGKANRVVRLAEKLGLKKLRFWPAEVLARVRALHAAGHTHGQIRDLMADAFSPGFKGRNEVRHIHLRLRLAPNTDTPHARRARREAVAAQLRTLGLAEVTSLRRVAHARLAARYGLPEDLKAVQVRMVLALAAGPLTVAELKERCGLRPGHQLLCNGRNTTYQADLVARGLAERLPTGIAGAVKGPRCRYLLTARCLELLTKGRTP